MFVTKIIIKIRLIFYCSADKINGKYEHKPVIVIIQSKIS